MMNALVYTHPREMTYREAAAQPLQAGEVRVQVEAAGICGSDMHAYLGHDERRIPPLILGHEVAGTIVEGEGAGSRVVLNPLITCGNCDQCQTGRTNLCKKRTMIGMTRPGGMAEHVVLPRENALPVSGDVHSSIASLTEPAACVWHARELIKRSLFMPIRACRVLVIGAGTIGLLAAKLFQNDAVRELIMVETNPIRQETAKRYEVGEVVDALPAAFNDSFDIVFDAVGSETTRNLSIDMVSAGGVVLHIGLQSNKGQLDSRRITLQEISFLGSYTYTRADFSATLSALENQQFGHVNWLEERALADGNRAFADLHDGQVAAAKIVLIP